MFMDIFANAFKAKSHYIKKYTFASNQKNKLSYESASDTIMIHNEVIKTIIKNMLKTKRDKCTKLLTIKS